MNTPVCDSERLTFLRALDEAADVDVTDFEARFIESALRYQTGAILFSDRQREVIEQMFRTYGHRVPIANRKSQIANHKLPETVPGRCAWLLPREDGRGQRRCNEPVADGKNFCLPHFEERQRVIARLRDQRARKPH